MKPSIKQTKNCSILILYLISVFYAIYNIWHIAFEICKKKYRKVSFSSDMHFHLILGQDLAIQIKHYTCLITK